MSDENKNKPKATLIKHRKEASSGEDNAKKADKKKVVVVKKKPKKKTVNIVAAKDSKPGDQEAKTAADSSKGSSVTSHNKPESGDSEDRNKKTGSPQKSSSGSEEIRLKQQGRTGGYRRAAAQSVRTSSEQQNRKPERGERTYGGGGQNRGNFRNDSRSRGPGQRPAGGGQRPPFQKDRRPGGPGGAGPRGGNRPGGFTPTPSEGITEKKTTSKKFFKAKKKGDYAKKQEIHEREFQIKKKANTQKANPIPKEIDIMEVITVSELARKMNLKASSLITKLMEMGMMVTINQQIDSETATLMANEFGCKVNIVSLYDETIIESNDKAEDTDLKHRPPIVTVMGHVDHGKTKLLDAIRQTNVVEGEHGGITQHIGAYKVKVGNGEVVFLDTPGHEAFTLMRARGAQVTDIVVLVVAANDGVMPQTVEAINHAKEAKVPIIVAVNKVDLPEANVDRVKQQMSEYDLIPEDWGGNTLFCEISALKKQGIKELLEALLLQAEMLELKANYDCRAEGKVIESKVDHGRGIVCSVIVQKGTLKVGDAFVAGIFSGKVRAIFDDKGEKVTEAPPSTPVEVIGLTGIPNAGDPFQVTENEKIARQVGAKRQELEKQGEAMNISKVTLDNLYDSIQAGDTKELKVIIRGDVHGSVEALQVALEKLSTSEIRLKVIDASAGAITDSAVNLAAASSAIIIGFHVRPTPKAQELAEKQKVEIRKYNIIYDVVEDVKSAMEGMLSPDIKEEVVGTVEVRDTFKVPKIGVIAGCYVTSGKITRGAKVRVYKNEVQVHDGVISSLKRFKDDVREVATGYECGLGIDNYNDLEVGDLIEVYVLKEVAKTLN